MQEKLLFEEKGYSKDPFTDKFVYGYQDLYLDYNIVDAIDIEEKNESLLAVIKGLHPEMNMQNIMAYITLRKLSSELESALEVFFGSYSLSAGRFLLMLLMKSHPEGIPPTVWGRNSQYHQISQNIDG